VFANITLTKFFIRNDKKITNTTKFIFDNAGKQSLKKIITQSAFVYGATNLSIQRMHLARNLVCDTLNNNGFKTYIYIYDPTLTNCGIFSYAITSYLAFEFEKRTDIKGMKEYFENNVSSKDKKTFIIEHRRFGFWPNRSHCHGFVIHKFTNDHYTILQSSQDETTYDEGIMESKIYSHNEIMEILNSYENEIIGNNDINQTFFKNKFTSIFISDNINVYQFN
jgi:hypothetical protein